MSLSVVSDRLVCDATLCDWLAKLAPSRIKNNRDLQARIFVPLAPAASITSSYSDWFIAHLASSCCDWSEQLFWFGFATPN